MQALVGVLEGPGVAGCILLHLQRGGRHTARIRRLARREGDSALPEVVRGFRGTRHVCTLSNVADLVLYQELGVIAVELVLGRTRQGNVGADLPYVAALVVFHTRASLAGVGGDALAADFLDVFEQLQVHAVRGRDVAGGIRHRHDGSAELLDLLGSVDGDVAGAGNNDLGAVEGLAVGLHHLRGQVDQTVAGGFSAHEGATPRQPLAREDPGLVLVF